jgi:superfamily II DNA/RNA helicase
MSFETLGLHPSILKALTDAGYTAPTPVQEQAVPAAIQGKDLLVSSQTGSGKTAAFMLPSLHRLFGFEPARKAHVRRTRNARLRKRAASVHVSALPSQRCWC